MAMEVKWYNIEVDRGAGGGGDIGCIQSLFLLRQWFPFTLTLSPPPDAKKLEKHFTKSLSAACVCVCVCVCVCLCVCVCVCVVYVRGVMCVHVWCVGVRVSMCVRECVCTCSRTGCVGFRDHRCKQEHLSV